MKLSDLVTILEDIAPTRYAEPWDNVGLLVGDPAQKVSKALLTIDYTAAVAAEVAEEACDVVIAYHPPIFHPLKRLTAPSLIYDAIRRGVAIYSPHTALDVAEGGTNDVLADAIGITWPQPLRRAEGRPTHYKLVVFVPEPAADAVAQALFDAGAGRIGDYSACSFRSPGTGTFFGEAGAKPAIGRPGQLERVPELRLETVLPIGRAEEVIAALRQTHPYEAPAFDLVQLAARPEACGLGRFGDLAVPAERSTVIDRIKRELDIDHVLVAGPTEGLVKRAAVGAGACGDLLDDAIRERVDLYLTGEMRHHDAIKAAAAGITVVCTLHSNSERAVLSSFAAQINELLPRLPMHISETDRDPFELV